MTSGPLLRCSTEMSACACLQPMVSSGGLLTRALCSNWFTEPVGRHGSPRTSSTVTDCPGYSSVVHGLVLPCLYPCGGRSRLMARPRSPRVRVARRVSMNGGAVRDCRGAPPCRPSGRSRRSETWITRAPSPKWARCRCMTWRCCAGGEGIGLRAATPLPAPTGV